MKVSTKSVAITLLLASVIMVAAMTRFYPKMTGPLSELGNAIHETRVDLLGAEDFRVPRFRQFAYTTRASRESLFSYQSYGKEICDTCPIPIWISTRFGEHQIRIMNIKPKYQRGMELPAGKYDIEIDYGSPRRTFRETVSLTPDNRLFEYTQNVRNGGEVVRVKY